MENEKNALNDISKAELKARGVSSLATRPNAPSRYGEGGLTAEQLKERFDALSGILAERINKIHAYLKASDLDKNISITIGGVAKTLAQFAEDLESGEAANYFTVKVGTNVSVSLQAAIDDILKDISDHGEASDENFRSTNARIDRSVATINIEPVVNGRNITIVLTAMNDQGEVVTTDSINVPNADNLIASHNESTDTHHDIRELIQSNGMQIASLSEDVAEVREVAEGRVRARAYRTWNDALLSISSFGTLEEARKEFAIGDQIYIRTPKSTDAWVSGFETRHEPYPGGLGDDLDPFDKWESTEIHVGYLIISPLEAPDIDLTGYVTTDDFVEYGEKVDSAVAETKEYVAKVVNSFDPPSADKVERLAAEVANLTARIAPEYFTTDSSVAYTKTVPADALPFAEVKEVGGMSYAEGGTLKNAAVTALESEGANLIDLRSCAGDTVFRLDIGKHLPAGVTYQISAVGTTEHPTDTKMLVAYSDSAQDKTKSIKYFTAGQRTYLTFIPEFDFNQILFYGAASYQNSLNVSFTVTDAMLTKGESAAPFAPYVKRSYPIPPEVQALDGWGEGISADCHNRVDFEKKQYRQEVRRIRLDGSEEWRKSVQEGIFQASTRLSKLAGNTTVLRPVISNGYGFFDWYQPDASVKPYFRIVPSSDALWIEATVDRFTDLDAWKAYLAANPVEIVYPLATPIVTDLPNLPDDNFIAVEGGGTITAVNEYALAAPTKIEYQLKEATA